MDNEMVYRKRFFRHSYIVRASHWHFRFSRVQVCGGHPWGAFAHGYRLFFGPVVIALIWPINSDMARAREARSAASKGKLRGEIPA